MQPTGTWAGGPPGSPCAVTAPSSGRSKARHCLTSLPHSGPALAGSAFSRHYTAVRERRCASGAAGTARGSERCDSRPGVRLRTAPRRGGRSCGWVTAAALPAAAGPEPLCLCARPSVCAWGRESSGPGSGEPRGPGAGSEGRRRRLRCGSRRRSAFIREGGRKYRRSAGSAAQVRPGALPAAERGAAPMRARSAGPRRPRAAQPGLGAAPRGAVWGGRPSLGCRRALQPQPPRPCRAAPRAAAGVCPNQKSSWDTNLGLCWAGGGCDGTEMWGLNRCLMTVSGTHGLVWFTVLLFVDVEELKCYFRS